MTKHYFIYALKLKKLSSCYKGLEADRVTQLIRPLTSAVWPLSPARSVFNRCFCSGAAWEWSDRWALSV